MLAKLIICNYALIDELTVDFHPGFNIITGETGTGKSIILGAFSLILGARADLSGIRNREKKCVVEGTFHVDGYGLESFFEKNDLDYDTQVILRREISPSGKSRAFINDTPVNLPLLRELTLQLVDIHSQYQNLELGSSLFQLQVVDAASGNHELFGKYLAFYDTYTSGAAKLEQLREAAAQAGTDLDYFDYQFTQLENARLQPGEQPLLEQELEILAHAEEIKSSLLAVTEILNGEHFPVIRHLKEIAGKLEKIRHYLKEAADYSDRIQTVLIELQDIAREAGQLAGKTDFDPRRMEQISERLDLIYTLEQKHHVSTVEELVALKEDFGKKISAVNRYEEEIMLLEKKLVEDEQRLKSGASDLSRSRKEAFPMIEKKVTDVLRLLGMPGATFRILHLPAGGFTSTGSDQIRFLFSANKDVDPEDISRVASGGEISRFMLAVKTLLADKLMLPTIVFDEIDSGISGETALKMGSILKKMAGGMQVINITHLPQIAGMGNHHYLVDKVETGNGTFTTIRELNEQERKEELARMVGGVNPSEAALKTAGEMLGRR
jgi:DNA repair protein RecN (Recombination protein N)